MYQWKDTSHLWKGEGIYHLTFTTIDRQPLLGELKETIGEGKAYVKWSKIGDVVLAETEKIITICPAIKICAKQIMPDHLHIVLWVTQPINKSIKEISRGFMQGCRHTTGQRIFDVPYIRTLSHTKQLRSMIDYIHDNPRRALERKQNPMLFQIKRHTEVSVNRGDDCITPVQLEFTSMGNHHLLKWPERQMIECSRRMVQEEIEKRKVKAIERAEQGAVTYTAAISEGEKQLARAIREKGYPLVVLMQDGFPKEGSEQERYYKPGGVYFDACCKGQLLLMEPTEESFGNTIVVKKTEETLKQKAAAKHQDYTTIPRNSQRWRFVAVNEMAKMLIEGGEKKEGQIPSARI